MREVSASVAAPDHNGDEGQSRAGYFAAIVVSALGHLALFALVFFIAPRYLHQPDAPPTAYTVKIVDNIPAGDIGTHLPRINRHRTDESKAESRSEEPKVKVEEPKPELAPNDDKDALALNAKKLDTPTATPTPEPTPEPTVEPTVEATPMPAETPKPTPKPKTHATPKPTPQASRHHAPKSEASIAIAKASATPSVEERLAALKRKNFKEHVERVAKMAAEEKKNADDDSDEDTDTFAGSSGGGPVVGSVASEGSGYGVGPGKGSVGILQDPEFLLYYKTVQDQIKRAWSFTGGSNDLTATVDFAIGPDGALTGAKIGASSNDSAFDDSVIRAIRRAAPFPAPPDKFRDQFSSGIKALFQLGELKS
jgi:TonB family protein